MLINRKICFVEADNEEITYTNKDNSTFKENYLLSINENIMLEGEFSRKINMTLPVSAFSEIYSNQIIASKVYSSDIRIENKGEYKPFDENLIKKNILCDNPLIFKKTYGVGVSEEFDDIYTLPFNDRPNLEIERNMNDIYYPLYYNAYSVHDLNSSISILGRIEEFKGTNTSESVFTGIVSKIVTNGNDARGRSVHIKDYESLVYENASSTFNINLKEIEPFTDEEDVFDENETMILRKFSYDLVEENGRVSKVLNVTNGAYSFVPKLSSNIIYYTDDNNDIVPFNDSVLEIKKIEMPHGTYFDRSISITSESIGFIGELD
jgi:hypothetical protein